MEDHQQDGRDEFGGFHVEDRRLFDAKGNRRSQKREEPQSPRREEREEEETPFLRLIIGIAAQALYALGYGRDDLEARPVDLAAARKAIDLLDTLSRKTAGNLDPGEKAVLEGQLTELRFLYVRRAEKGASD